MEQDLCLRSAGRLLRGPVRQFPEVVWTKQVTVVVRVQTIGIIFTSTWKERDDPGPADAANMADRLLQCHWSHSVCVFHPRCSPLWVHSSAWLTWSRICSREKEKRLTALVHQLGPGSARAFLTLKTAWFCSCSSGLASHAPAGGQSRPSLVTHGAAGAGPHRGPDTGPASPLRACPPSGLALRRSCWNRAAKQRRCLQQDHGDPPVVLQVC